MKLAVTATGADLEATIDPRFGRAAYFVVVDSVTLAFNVVNNSQSLDLPQGAGIQAGQTIVKNKVDVLITGHCGPKAFQVLQSAGVEIVTGASGTVKDAVMQYKEGRLKSVNEPNVEGHWV